MILDLNKIQLIKLIKSTQPKKENQDKLKEFGSYVSKNYGHNEIYHKWEWHYDCHKKLEVLSEDALLNIYNYCSEDKLVSIKL
jgi:hypothetical protein